VPASQYRFHDVDYQDIRIKHDPWLNDQSDLQARIDQQEEDLEDRAKEAVAPWGGHSIMTETQQERIWEVVHVSISATTSLYTNCFLENKAVPS